MIHGMAPTRQKTRSISLPRSCIDAKHSENLEDKYLGVSMIQSAARMDLTITDQKTMANSP